MPGRDPGIDHGHADVGAGFDPHLGLDRAGTDRDGDTVQLSRGRPVVVNAFDRRIVGQTLELRVLDFGRRTVDDPQLTARFGTVLAEFFIIRLSRL